MTPFKGNIDYYGTQKRRLYYHKYLDDPTLFSFLGFYLWLAGINMCVHNTAWDVSVYCDAKFEETFSWKLLFESGCLEEMLVGSTVQCTGINATIYVHNMYFEMCLSALLDQK